MKISVNFETSAKKEETTAVEQIGCEIVCYNIV